MKLEPVIQSEVNQKEKHQFCILTHTYGIEADGNEDPRCKAAKELHSYILVSPQQVHYCGSRFGFAVCCLCSLSIPPALSAHVSYDFTSEFICELMISGLCLRELSEAWVESISSRGICIHFSLTLA